jgi:peptide/nickel transport system permease protein
MIISEATLSFLGVGIPPSIPTLGGILNDAQTYLFSAWWVVVFPGVVLMAIVLSFNLIGRFLRDYFDPQIDI